MKPQVVILVLVIAAGFLVAVALQPAGAGEWEFLSTATIGADRFLETHPQWDGRGVLIAVCDSGVELGLPGLQQTSDGKVKILDAREFSDEGRFSLQPAQRASDKSGVALHGEGGRWLYGADSLDPAPSDDGETLIGYIEETRYRNSSVDDLNNNGRSDDVFGLVVYRPAGAGEDEPWLAVLDTDADADLADEQTLHDYEVAQESFTLGGNDPRSAADLVTYALNLWPEDKQAALVFDGNGHGTHVAATAAGYRINGQEGFYGIAPGAQVLAYKIGNNSLAGGATTPGSMLNAWRHAVAKADELGMPLVIQMSYGIGSEDEGQAVAEELIDSLLAANPQVVATVSAGNSGPGLSTIGLPSSSQEVIAVGAAFARTTAELVYGFSWPEDRIFYFSARGGEMARPMVMAPGFEAAEVPVWTDGRDVLRGTSMAAPQAAGAAALLLSAAAAQELPLRRDLVRAVLQRTARWLAGYGPLDQGPAGMIDVPRAWNAYSMLARRDGNDPVAYRVRTASPEMAGGEGPAVFYRGDFYPRGDDRHEISIEPIFPDDAPDSFVRSFYRAFELECDADWVRPDKPATYIKQRRAAVIPLAFDDSKLRRPGLYQTRLLAYDKSLGRNERRLLGPEVVVPISVVVPARLDDRGTLSHSAAIDTAMTDRLFVRVTPDIGALTYEVELPRAELDRSLGVALFDPEGRRRANHRLDRAQEEVRHTVPARLLEPGVWELVMWGRQANRGPVHPRLRLAALPAAAVPTEILLEHTAGSTPQGEIELTSLLDRTWRGRALGVVTGIVRQRSEEVSGAEYTYSFNLAPEEQSIVFAFELEPETHRLFTDLAVTVLDSGGRALVQSGFSYRRLQVSFDRPEDAAPGATYTLKLVAGLADPGSTESEWFLGIRELRRLAEPVKIDITQGGSHELVLYPDHPTRLALELAATPPERPAAYSWLLELELEPADQRQPGMLLELEAD